MRSLPALLTAAVAFSSTLALAQKTEPSFPPKLPGGKEVVTDTSKEFLRSPGNLREGVVIAKTPPTIDFLYFPGQDWAGRPWSNWGDSLAVGEKYYASIGDHLAPRGKAFVYEYDAPSKTLRQQVDVTELLDLPQGHYTPGKIHSRIDRGSDGWLYFATHRGSTKATTDANHYLGDWIVRYHPDSGKSEVVAQGPVPKHCIPTSVLDPDRLIFYGGTAPGSGDPDAIYFFAYDIKNRKVLHASLGGPARYLIFARSTGRVYYRQGKDESGALMRFDPEVGEPVSIPGELGIRAATEETPEGFVYTVSSGQGEREATLWRFNTKTEKAESLGPAAVASQQYITSLDADPTGRYLYYIPGAHGGSDRDGTPVVQYDTKTRTRKVLAFLHPFNEQQYDCALVGTYSSALAPAGDKLYVTWNARRPGTRHWDCCALTVIHIPQSERE